MHLSRVVAAGPVVLRPWEVDDLDGMTRAVGESVEHLRPWMPWAAAEPLSTSYRRALIETFEHQRQAGEGFVYGMFHDDEPVGGTGLHPRIAEGLEIGYWVHPGWTGRGFATAASQALTDAAFAEAGVRCVEIHHDKANTISGRVPATLGFELVAEVADEPKAPGEIGIECQWRVTRQQWASRPSQADQSVDVAARHRRPLRLLRTEEER